MPSHLPPRSARLMGAALSGVILLASCSGGEGIAGPSADTQAPTITASAPAEGTVVAADSVDVTVAASDDRGLLRLGYVLNGASGDSVTVSGTSATHTFRVRALRDGANAIALVARDAGGNLSAVRTIGITFRRPDVTAPVLVLTAPATGSYLRADTLRVTGRATDDVGVRRIRVVVNGGAADSVLVTGTAADFAFTVRGLAPARHRITVVAIDSAGNVSVPVEATITRDTVAPLLGVHTPTDSAVVTRDTVVVSGLVRDTASGLQSLTMSVGGGAAQPIVPDATGAFATVVRGLAEGATALTFSATDSVGNVATHVVTVTYRRPPAGCALPAGFTKAWIGATKDWRIADNWSPSGTPGATDDAFVCASAAIQPHLTENTAVRSLRVERGATLDTEFWTLTVHGHLEAAGAITGHGTVVMAGRDVTISGTVPRLSIDGAVTTADTVTVRGDLEGDFDLTNGLPRLEVRAPLRVGGGLFMNFGLVMRDEAALLDVRGTVNLGGGQGSYAGPFSPYRDSVTAGRFHVGGTFRSDASPSYNPKGTHTLVLDGTESQQVALFRDDDEFRRLNHVEIRNPAGVHVAYDAFVRGQLTMFPGAILTQDTLYSMVYDTRLPSTTTGYQVRRTVAGSAVRLTQDVVLQLPAGGRLEMGCGACTNGSRLTVGPHRLTVNGDLYAWYGTLAMYDARGVIDVRGSATFSGAYAADSLLAGTMRLTGDLMVQQGTWGQYVYRPNPAHTVVFDGTSEQRVSFAMPYPTHQHLPGVEVRNPAGVRLDTLTYVTGLLRMVGDGLLTQRDTAHGVVFVALENGGSTGPASLASPLPITSAGYRITNNVLAGHFALDADRDWLMPAGGRLTLGADSYGGGYLRNAGHSLTIRGDLVANHGLIMQYGDAARISVRGNVRVNDAFGADSMLAGTLAVRGDFTQVAGPNWGFQPGGTHVTLFDGATPQRVDMGSSSFGTRRFQNLRVAVGSTVQLTSNAHVAGFADIFGTLSVAAGTRTGVEHSIYLRSGATLDNAGSLFCNHTYTRGVNATLAGAAPTCNGGKGTLRVRLGWTNAAANLDAYFTGPAVDGSTAQFTVSPFEQRYEFDGALFTSFNPVFTNFASGPELIESYTTAGRYRFEVRSAPGSAAGTLAASGATVVVESFLDLGDRIQVTELARFTVPASAGERWSVFELENRTVLPLP